MIYIFNHFFTITLYFRNINDKIQELLRFLQKFEITKSSEILTPKSKQKYLQTEIKKVYCVISRVF